MTLWTNTELEKINSAEELNISSLRQDGTLRKAVVIWVVRLRNDLYVRSVNGRTSAWYQSTQILHEGHIRAGGIDKDVTFLEADPSITDQIDNSYRTKYHQYASSIIASIISPKARAATIKLIPR